MKHVSEYSSEEWVNARDRRNKRRTEGDDANQNYTKERS